MIECTFELNSKPMSALKCGASSFPAFSGFGPYVNRPEYSCNAGTGPIPAGRYYILDRESGGLLGPLRDLLSHRTGWFALYAIDGKIDDVTYCNRIKRGNFRLHPKGALGICEGCITIESQSDFNMLTLMLRGTSPSKIPGTELKAYGKVTVK